eukprot:1159251-Pelagomonas_calceolata.AAC.2
MEQALTKLGETWSRVDFQFIQFKDTPVYTVKMADEDFEALEDNQVRKHSCAHPSPQLEGFLFGNGSKVAPSIVPVFLVLQGL